eukprot:SM000037S13499  [mRNA]  locus=s37:246587:250173:- [translate_table: standard]
MEGHMGPPVGQEGVGEPGSSMRGVTGKESVFGYNSWTGQNNDPTSKFKQPVDSEHKATTIRLYSIAQPHMRSFHLSWISFFTAFVSAFAAPPLIPVIRENLDLTKSDIGNAGIAAVTGALFSRLMIGTLCDLFGPRQSAAALLMLTAPAVMSMCFVRNYIGFMIVRCCIGLSLGTFVSCQYWMSSMFNTKIIGVANGLAAGWGNLGGGATQLIMPLIYNLIHKDIGSSEFTAWRIAFFVPAVVHILMGLLLLFFAQDLPDGQYRALKKSGQKVSDSGTKVIWNAVSNYRTWIFTITYGYCFGVELTIDNVIANYFYDRFDMNLTDAGYVAASFGLMNIFSRPLGGVMSDMSGARYGMRGRIWLLYIIQTLGGVFCLILGKINTLALSIVIMLIFSFFVQAACGCTFGIIPFVSRRSLGVISGLVGAGGNAGSAITQAIFFTGTAYTTEQGLTWMGVMIICVCVIILLVWFPMWGGAIFPARAASTEENYYGNEWSAEEKMENKHVASLKFAENARSERGATGYQDYIDTNGAPGAAPAKTVAAV